MGWGQGGGWTLHRDQTGPKLGPISWWESSRTGTLGSQHVPWSARACSKGRWENEEMENTQDLSETPQAPADCSSVPQSKSIAFQCKQSRYSTLLMVEAGKH